MSAAADDTPPGQVAFVERERRFSSIQSTRIDALTKSGQGSRTRGRPPRVAFLGSPAVLEDWAPCGADQPFGSERFAIDAQTGPGETLARLEAFQGDVVMVLDPAGVNPEALECMPGITVGLLPELPSDAQASRCARLDRLVCFDPASTGAPVAGQQIWRAVPPPVSDAFFRDGEPQRRPRRAIAVGASTAHREAMLMPAKHHHDVLQVIHGINGEALAGLLDECSIAINVNRRFGGGFEWPVGAHLAAGQLLLSEPLRPAHGLETNLDYLRFESPEDLVLMLDRLAMFPEMHLRTQIRGRMKAEAFRSSRVFARLVHDVLLDFAAFGRGRQDASG